jgi:hypothetical protein
MGPEDSPTDRPLRVRNRTNPVPYELIFPRDLEYDAITS